jgi:C4-dicarboxylate-specific signal transduction histidine kinase
VLRHANAISFKQELAVGGAVRTFVTVKFPLHDATGATYGVGSVATDIGRMKQLQEDLRQHQDELAHVLRLHTITEMAAGLAHEINQPLCAITNYAQGGVQRLRRGDAKPRDLLHAFQRIADEGLRAGDIIRGIRNLAQRASPSESIDVNALAAEAVRLLASRARQQSVTMHLDRALGLPRVCGDGTQIEQVILNLMLNGVEAIEGSTNERRELIVATRARAGGVEVNVSDTGTGLAPSVAEKLFSPFVTTKAGGLGLGLAISRSIVELHGGRLWATPNAARGTTFNFWLPAAATTTPAEEVA